MRDRKGFILSGILVITGRRMRRRRKGEWQQTLQRYDKSPTSKFTPVVLVVTVIYFAPWGEEKNGGVQCPWGFSCYPAVRTGSSNTHFFSCFFFCGHLPQTSGFRSAKQILVLSFATQARAFILSDRNIFYTRGGGGRRRGLMPLGLFLFFWWSLAPDLRFSLGQTNKCYKLSVTISIIFCRLEPIRQNLQEDSVDNL